MAWTFDGERMPPVIAMTIGNASLHQILHPQSLVTTKGDTIAYHARMIVFFGRDHFNYSYKLQGTWINVEPGYGDGQGVCHMRVWATDGVPIPGEQLVKDVAPVAVVFFKSQHIVGDIMHDFPSEIDEAVMPKRNLYVPPPLKNGCRRILGGVANKTNVVCNCLKNMNPIRHVNPDLDLPPSMYMIFSGVFYDFTFLLFTLSSLTLPQRILLIFPLEALC
jgi:hypothetical protein